ncbi:hypothetical protein CK203_108951 [Vitis vinifera]|uniref:Uncharacterized protein n=1 Tax=Vitis vinifera TaxID=29760 RepID=A0A438FFL6_VITVI|nr:hypothetical protein CK203_108951 [Vitis vinifera]
MQEASSPRRGGRIGGGVLDQHLVEEHCDKNLEESLNESLEVLEDGLPEPSDVLAIMSPWRRREEILPLFNKEDSQGAAMEDPPKLVLKPLPVDLKYAYWRKMRNVQWWFLQLSLVIKRIVFWESSENARKPLDGKFLI